MINLDIMMNINCRRNLNGSYSDLLSKAVGGKGETHVLFSQAADNFTSTLRARSVVGVLFSKNLIGEAAVWVALPLRAVSRSIRSQAGRRKAGTL
jgi:hypothetical protein